MDKFKSVSLSILILAFMLLFAAFSATYIPVMLGGIELWAVAVLPSLFPFIFGVSLLSSLKATEKIALKTGKITRALFNTGGYSSYAFLMSALCGNPIGAKLIAEMYEGGLLYGKEAERTSAFATTASPMFVIGSIGSVLLGDALKGTVIFLSHILACIATGIIFRFYGAKEKPVRKFKPLGGSADNMLYDAAYSSVLSVLIVGAFIAVFYTLAKMLLDFNLLSPVIYLFNLVFKDENVSVGLAAGLIECTSGAKILAAANSIYSLPLIAFIITFGGVSIILQCCIYLKKAKVKTAAFLLFKAVAAVLSFIICFIICRIFF